MVFLAYMALHHESAMPYKHFSPIARAALGWQAKEMSGIPVLRMPPENNVEAGLTNFGSAAQASTFIHGESAGGDITIDDGALVEVAAVAAHIADDVTVDVHLAGLDVAFDIGHFTDGHLAGFGLDFSIDFTIDVHVVLEADGTDNFDTGSQNICGVVAHVCDRGG